MTHLDVNLVLPEVFAHPDDPDAYVPCTPDVEAWIGVALHGDVPWQHTLITTRTAHSPITGLLLHVGPNTHTCLAVSFSPTGRWLYTTFSPGSNLYCPRPDEGITASQASRIVGIQLESDAAINSWMSHRLNTHAWTRSHAEHDRLTRLHAWVEQGHQEIIRRRVLEQLAEEHHERFTDLLDAALVQRALGGTY